MAWAFIQDAGQVTLEDYDRVAAEIGDDPPEGLILHVVGRRGDSFRIIDVWESEDAYMRFRDERLGPTVEKVLGPEAMAQGPPPIEPLDVHHMIRGSQ